MDDILPTLALWSVSALAIAVTFALLLWGAVEDGRTDRRRRAR
jgi:hypothetical protein